MEVYHTEIFILLYLMRKCHLLLWVNYSRAISFATAAVKAADNPRRECQDSPGEKKFPMQLYLQGNIRKVLKFDGVPSHFRVPK